MAAKREVLELVFGLPYAGPCIPLIICGAISVAALNQFAWGYTLFLLAGIWAAGHWWISDPVRERRRLLRVFKYGSPEYLEAKKSYRIWLSAGEGFFLLLTFAAIWWTCQTKKSFERDQVYQHLALSLSVDGDDPLRTRFTVTNDSGFAISARHRLLCGINLMAIRDDSMIHGPFVMQTSTGWYMDNQELLSSPLPVLSRIKPGGDAQTDSCLSVFNIRKDGLDCADVFLRFDYYLEDQPNVIQQKAIRIIYQRVDGERPAWHGEPLESTTDYCFSYLSPLRQQDRRRHVQQNAEAFRRLRK